MMHRMNRFERSPADARPNSNEKLHVVEDKATQFPKRCEQFITRYERQRPSIEEIVDLAPRGLYRTEDVVRDITYEERLEGRFRDAGLSDSGLLAAKRGQFAEAYLASRIVDESWFGKDCEVFVTSRVDDISNRVDFVLEWQDAKSKGEDVFQLAVDVTTAVSLDVLNGKVDDIQSSLRGKAGGKQGPVYLSEVQYYQSPHTDKVERLTFLPKVIIALSPEQVDEAMQLVENKQVMSERDLKDWVVPMSQEILAQLQQQAISAMREVCKQYMHFLPLMKVEDAASIAEPLDAIDAGLQRAVISGSIYDLFEVYDAFIALADTKLEACEAPLAYKNLIFVVHAIMPVTAHVHGVCLEQKKRFRSAKVDT